MPTSNPEMYKACPFRNVDAAFERFYEAPDASFGVATALGRMRLRINGVGDRVHRLILRRRAARLNPFALAVTGEHAAAGWLKRKIPAMARRSATAAAM